MPYVHRTVVCGETVEHRKMYSSRVHSKEVKPRKRSSEKETSKCQERINERVAEEQERTQRHEMLVEAMTDLNDREKHILAERRLAEESKTLEELSQVYGVSRERVRQIEVRAFEKLQSRMTELARSKGLLPSL